MKASWTPGPWRVRRSIEINAERFGYGDEIKRLLLNTVDEVELTDAVR